jgi:hypothetical protein
VLANRIRAGAPYHFLAAPVIGSAVTISDLDGLALAAHLDGHSEQALVAAVEANLRDLGRELEQNGRRLEGTDRDAFLGQQIDRFRGSTLPWLHRLGAVA